MNFIIICLIVGSIAGVLSGLFGIGAGIIMIPGMIYLLGFNQHMAQGTSLAIMLPPISIFAVMQYYKTGNIDLRATFWIAIAFVLTSFFGANLALELSNTVLRKIFGIVMLVMALRMIITK
ncbi:MAG: sulfite exporter TauE/SafE family protein [Candidatus Margulisbacteria bacterium]|nr:sulfite exporter TauE/SafE family protein [Candidatus Margulisiibacteriota bacterium]